jgi:hypothetical protein
MSNKQPKQLNVGQQPNDPKLQKAIAQQLGARNIGVDKILLNINSGQSELPTNNNSIIKYSLKQPIQLEVGDTITLMSSFVEEKGLAENTISFEQDIEAEMRFVYYKQSDPGDTLISGEDVGFVQYPKLFPDAYVGASSDYNTLVSSYLDFEGYGPLYSDIVADFGLNGNYSDAVYNDGKQDNLTSGPNGQMNILMETCKYYGDINIFYRPVYGKKRIKVKAGNYSVDSLANIITAQMNGSIGSGGDTFSDALKDKLYFPNRSFNTPDKFWRTLPYFRDVGYDAEDIKDTPIFGENPLIPAPTSFGQTWDRTVEGMVRMINYSAVNYYNCFRYNQLVEDDNERFNPAFSNINFTYPNGRKDTNDFPIKDSNGNREVELGNILYPNIAQSNSAAINFYAGLNHVYELFDNEYGWYYCNPKLEDDTFDGNDPYRPPTWSEMMEITIDTRYGIIPFYSANGAAYEAKYPKIFYRGPDTRRAMVFNTLYPVQGLNYPGSGGLLPSRNVYAGTSVAELTFSDEVANRFAFQNFHEFYKLPNITPDGKSTTSYGGQQATKYNNPYYNDTGGGSATENDNGYGFEGANAVYPIDSSSGIMITNFDFDLVKDTNTYKNLKAEIDALETNTAGHKQKLREKKLFDLLTKPFDQFFDTEQEAKTAWNKSLWSRLGFTYDQLGNVSKNLETNSTMGSRPQTVNANNGTPLNQTIEVGRKNLKNFGIITHNSFDYSKIVSSDGLGQGNPQVDSGTPLQNYVLKDYYPGVAFNTNNLGISGNIFHIMANSKPMNAANLPSLNAGKSYLLIESDIIKPNYKDVRANWGNLLGIMSKENSTNDTIFGTQPIDFTITEPRLLSDITLYIKNPDGTLAGNDVIGENCGFILQITKAIKPQALATVDPP